MMMTQSEPQYTFFWKGPLSQWQRCRFVVDGVAYNCAEQFMMAQKAALFGDRETLEQILASKSPREQKAFGRKVRRFDASRWNSCARDIVYRGNWARFTQNLDLQEILLATFPTLLVEASPEDTIWGIGLAEDDPRAWERKTWRGTNWLGEVLTRVRDDIMAEKDKS
jgi:ribA/ribD-fused uncharacterized protein